MIPQIWLIGILGASLAVAGAGWQGYRLGKDSVIADQAREDQLRMETLHLAQQAAAEEISKIEIRQVTIRGKVEREIIERPVYRDCTHDDRTLRLLNDALTGTESAEPASQGELPSADAAARF